MGSFPKLHKGQYFPVVKFVILYKVVLSLEYISKDLNAWRN